MRQTTQTPIDNTTQENIKTKQINKQQHQNTRPHKKQTNHQQEQHKHEQTTTYKTHNRKQDNKHTPASSTMKKTNSNTPKTKQTYQHNTHKEQAQGGKKGKTTLITQNKNISRTNKSTNSNLKMHDHTKANKSSTRTAQTRANNNMQNTQQETIQ